MKFFKNKQTALKTLLLLTLIGNVSFEPLKQTIESVNLSQVADETASASGGGQPAAQGAPAAAAPAPATPAADGKAAAPAAAPSAVDEAARLREELNKLRAERAAGNEAEQLRKRIADLERERQSKGAKSVIVEFCKNKSAGIEFTETGSELQGRITEADCEQCRSKAFLVNGGNTDENRKALIAEMRKTLAKSLGCSDQQIADRDKSKDSGAEEEAERKEQVKNCEVKKRFRGGEIEYVDLSETEALKCNINRLRNLKREERLKGEDLAERVEEFFNDKIKGPLKAALRSKDADDVEKAKELATQLTSTLGTVGLSEKKETKLIKMVEGFKVGGEANRRTREIEKDAKEVGDELRTAWNALQKDPLDMDARFNFDMLLQRRNQLRSQLDTDVRFGTLPQLEWYKKQQFITSQDYNDFASSYTTLEDYFAQMVRMNGRGGLAGGGNGVRRIFDYYDSAIPTDLYSIRSSTGDGFLRRGSALVPSTVPNRLNLNAVERDLGLNRTFSGPRTGGATGRPLLAPR